MRVRILLYLYLLMVATAAHAVELPRRASARPAVIPRLYTISPYQIRSGQITEIVLQGQNLVPGMEWVSADLRILKQQWIDTHTVILTVLALGSSGIRTLSANGSQPLSFEVQSSTILFSDDFNDGNLSDWIADKGTWTPVNGEAEVVTKKKAKLFAPLDDTDNVTIDFDLTMISGKRVGLYFHFRNKGNCRLLTIDSKKKTIRLTDRFDGSTDFSERFPFDAELNVPHHYSVVINNNRVALAIDGSTLFNRDLAAVYRGTIALYAKSCTARFDNVVVSRDNAANVIPLADFKYSVVERDASFNATTSIDPDGTILSYDWKFGDNTTGKGANTVHGYPSDGNFKVVLGVTDNSGATTKKALQIIVVKPLSDREAIQQVVRHFFELLADLETLSGEQICVDFSRQPSCPAYLKQVKDLNSGKPDVDWFDVEFLSDVSVTFQSSTEAFPVRIRNLLSVRYKGDPTTYWTDGWHVYTVQKEGDGKWHQCSYSFDLIADFQP
jgi:PKD repeat protein